MRRNLGCKRLKVSNNCLENILLIIINGLVLRNKIHEDFNNILVLRTVDLYFQKRIGDGTYVLQAKKILEKNEESLFGPPIKRVVQEISSSDDSSSESDSSEPDSD